MYNNFFKWLSIGLLLVGVTACSDSEDVNKIIIDPPVNPEKINIDHTPGLWSGNIESLVRKATDKSSPFIDKIYSYSPAVGQFVNKLPEYKVGDTEKKMISKTADALVGDNSSLVTLGGYGGYVIFGFDHTVENRKGLRDFRILGNAFEGNAEPGIIMVSYDANNNGIPDDPWFEIEGSEYVNAIKGYTITYYNPVHANWNVTDKEYIKWEDNQGNTGFISKNKAHAQEYFPEWLNVESITIKGNRLPDNIEKNGIVKLNSFEYGYADNVANDHIESAIDIDWAIDIKGERVNLPGIDFVKVYTGQFQDGGDLGETSTEVKSAVDLHLLGEEIPTRVKDEWEHIGNTRIVSHTVGKGLASYSPITRIPNDKSKYHVTKVFDFLPSYGQFTNDLPKYKEGDTHESMISKAEAAIAKEKPTMISLGGYGGYVVAGFDHTVENKKGFRDIRVLGNAFWAAANPNGEASNRGGSCEPGIIMVSYDENKNGLPDDEWYEIRGSEYDKTIKDYELIYWKPVNGKKAVKDSLLSWAIDVEYMKWKNNKDNKGYKPQNSFHKQSYYPNWINNESITFRGSLLPNNAIDESGKGTYWVLYSFGFGYADNAPNNDDESAIDIDWAVNDKGERVHLPGVDFVKIYTGVDQEAGWLGETSTEVAGIIDLHLKGESIPTRIVNF